MLCGIRKQLSQNHHRLELPITIPELPAAPVLLAAAGAAECRSKQQDKVDITQGMQAAALQLTQKG
jgi:hypothetical protein